MLLAPFRLLLPLLHSEPLAPFCHRLQSPIFLAATTLHPLSLQTRRRRECCIASSSDCHAVTANGVSARRFPLWPTLLVCAGVVAAAQGSSALRRQYCTSLTI